MGAKQWIVIPNWDDHQHYKNRNPPWIKNHLKLLHNDAYLGLTLHQRGVLHGLWLEYAATNGELLDSTTTVSRRLGERVSTATLKALNDAGFIEFSASKPLALRARSREGEKEKEKKALPFGTSREDRNGAFVAPDLLKSVEEGIRDR